MPSSGALATRAAMRQLMSFLAIALLLLSHSVVGDAAPHADGSIHGHTHDADVEHDGHDDLSDTIADDKATPEAPDEPVGQASGHMHLPGAVLPDADAGLVISPLVQAPAFPLVSRSLTGRGTAPLIEPPSV